MKIEVRDTNRTITFDGMELAHSSSHHPGKGRWIEFWLYRTLDGRYVLSRLGATLYFHSAYCDTVRRNYIDPLPSSVVAKNMIPCERCKPSRDKDEFVYPEVSRHWAQVSNSPDGVVMSLKKEDENGSEYFTTVARNLIEDAAAVDAGISDSYYSETLT